MVKSADQHPEHISEILKKWNLGDQDAWNRLVPLVYDELKKRARAHFRKEHARHTLQTSAIVHETYLKLADQRQVNWENRGHFFWVASEVMRRILVDHARARKRQKRGGGIEMLTLDSTLRVAAESSEVDLLELNDALESLAEKDIQQAKIVELRYFGGCSIEETAATLGIAPATVKRDWACAKAWLHSQLTTDRE